ncbi:hypothetical protein GMLC_11880 [Geomonas limicola]|uniref:Uncharacterized protein n=1 Tax=Geomonas limicola TaxID=2740186 RepID=A0A6V8N8G5_9BACT|nr:hypothetical protein GMLC_11880 [Geomonas limicola]
MFALPGLAPLREPDAFTQATLGEFGWEAEWPDFDIQIGADTLFADLLEQRAQTGRALHRLAHPKRALACCGEP